MTCGTQLRYLITINLQWHTIHEYWVFVYCSKIPACSAILYVACNCTDKIISCFQIWFLKVHICYLPAGRSVLGKTVPEVLRIRPEAAGRGPYSRPRAQFFPIRTDLGRQITCLLFSSVEYFVSSFCVEFSLQPFSNLVYAGVWHLGNRKSTLRSFAFLCFLGHYLHFTFLSVKKKLLEKTRKLEN